MLKNNKIMYNKYLKFKKILAFLKLKQYIKAKTKRQVILMVFKRGQQTILINNVEVQIPEEIRNRIGYCVFNEEDNSISIKCKQCEKSFKIMELKGNNFVKIDSESYYRYVSDKSGYSGSCVSCETKYKSSAKNPNNKTEFKDEIEEEYINLHLILYRNPISKDNMKTLTATIHIDDWDYLERLSEFLNSNLACALHIVLTYFFENIIDITDNISTIKTYSSQIVNNLNQENNVPSTKKTSLTIAQKYIEIKELISKGYNTTWTELIHTAIVAFTQSHKIQQ